MMLLHCAEPHCTYLACCYIYHPIMAALKSYRATFVSDDNESWVKDSLLKITIIVIITTITIITLLMTTTTTTLTITMTIIVVMAVQEAKLGTVTDEPSQQPLQHRQSSSSPFYQLGRA